MPKILRKISIDEVSSVPSGAGRGTRIVFKKRNPYAEHHHERADAIDRQAHEMASKAKTMADAFAAYDRSIDALGERTAAWNSENRVAAREAMMALDTSVK